MLYRQFRRFGHAFRGLSLFLLHEPSSYLHVLAAGIVVVAGWYFQITSLEWVAIVLCIGLVFAAEMFNSSIERLANRVTSVNEEVIRDLKDVSAGAVLFTAIAAFAAGLIIFLPRVLTLF